MNRKKKFWHLFYNTSWLFKLAALCYLVLNWILLHFLQMTASTQSRVLLENVQVKQSGTYLCEVTVTPGYYALMQFANMTVVGKSKCISVDTICCFHLFVPILFTNYNRTLMPPIFLANYNRILIPPILIKLFNSKVRNLILDRLWVKAGLKLPSIIQGSFIT